MREWKWTPGASGGDEHATQRRLDRTWQRRLRRLPGRQPWRPGAEERHRRQLLLMRPDEKSVQPRSASLSFGDGNGSAARAPTPSPDGDHPPSARSIAGGRGGSAPAAVPRAAGAAGGVRRRAASSRSTSHGPSRPGPSSPPARRSAVRQSGNSRAAMLKTLGLPTYEPAGPRPGSEEIDATRTSRRRADVPGRGRQASLLLDYTFGSGARTRPRCLAWPVGKATSGFLTMS